MIYQSNDLKRVDKLIGQKILVLRAVKQVPQKELALAIGVSSQQLSKYESGANKVSASRLLSIASALDCTISYFYEGLHQNIQTAPLDPQLELMCVELSYNFMKIKNAKHQEAVNTLVKLLAEAA